MIGLRFSFWYKKGSKAKKESFCCAEPFSKMNLKQLTLCKMAMGRLSESDVEVCGQRMVLQPAHL